MLDRESIEQWAEEAFENHEITGMIDSKSWLVKTPGKGMYWFKVTWTPGALYLMGDIGELTIVHYHAMPTWISAVQLIDGCDYGYIMGKTNTKKEFDLEETLKFIIEQADDDSYDNDLWEKIAKYIGHDFDEKKIDEYREYISNNASELFQPHQLYDVGLFDDYFGSSSYPADTYWQYKALQHWAKLVKESDEYKTAKEAA